MKFSNWIDALTAEKRIDGTLIEVEGPSGTNVVPLECLIAEIKSAPASEQAAIKTMIVKIDFLNGDVLDYFRHLARAIAV